MSALSLPLYSQRGGNYEGYCSREYDRASGTVLYEYGGMNFGFVFIVPMSGNACPEFGRELWKDLQANPE